MKGAGVVQQQQAQVAGARGEITQKLGQVLFSPMSSVVGANNLNGPERGLVDTPLINEQSDSVCGEALSNLVGCLVIVIAEDRVATTRQIAQGGERRCEGPRRFIAFHRQKVTGEQNQIGIMADKVFD